MYRERYMYTLMYKYMLTLSYPIPTGTSNISDTVPLEGEGEKTNNTCNMYIRMYLLELLQQEMKVDLI